MRFAISNSGSCDKLQNYKPILKKYDLGIELAYDEFDENDSCEIYYITINSIEELLRLKNELKTKLVILDYFLDGFSNCHDGLTIEIYDDYRE